MDDKSKTNTNTRALGGNRNTITDHTLKGGRLKFRTGSVLLAQEARQSMAGGRDFTIALSQTGHREVTGRVLSVRLLEGVNPEQLEIVMRV